MNAKNCGFNGALFGASSASFRSTLPRALHRLRLPMSAPSDPDATVVLPAWSARTAGAHGKAQQPAPPDDDATRVLSGAAPAAVNDMTVVRSQVTWSQLTTAKTGLAEQPPDGEVLRQAPDMSRSLAPDGSDDDALAGIAGLHAPLAQLLALQAGFQLHEYRIDDVLGQGGFGITYLATDVHLDAKVAIKEYLPEEIAFRTQNGAVSANASAHQARYRRGLESFLVEARTLASFRHPAIVRVARFFEAHQTAYMVLEYEQGSPFRLWWPRMAKQVREPAALEARLIELLLPLLDGLATVHEAGYLHRDIKPDNIQVRRSDGSLVLLDFGSASQTLALSGEQTVVVTPGYAPIEQYGLGQQGPWTDLYALAATLYWAVCGRKPPDAESRARDPAALVPAQQLARGRYGQAFLGAIDAALDTDASRRPRTVAAFRQALCADHVSSMNLQQALQQGDSALDSQGDSLLGGHAGSHAGAGKAAATAAKHKRKRSWPQALRQRAGISAWRWRAPRDWPLTVKMTGAMLATALLPMTLVGAYNLDSSVKAVTRGELQSVRQMAQSTAGRVSQFVQDGRHVALAMSGDRAFISYLLQPDDEARDELRDKLQRLVKADPDVQLVMLMDLEGKAVVSSDPQVMGRNFRFRDYFQQAIGGRSHVTGIIVGSVAGASGLFLAEPVRDILGNVIGALVLRIRGSSVVGILDEVQRDSTLTPLLIDGDGVVVHHPKAELLYSSLAPLDADALARIKADQRFRRDTVQSLGETELAQAMVRAKTTGHVSWRSAVTGVDQIAGYSPVPGLDWVVGVVESRATFEEPLQRLYSHMLWSVLLVGLVFTVLALSFARSIVRPVRALTQAAHALKAGDHDAARVRVESRDEVGQLARTFNIMIDVLRQRERESRRGEAGRGPV